MMFKIELAAYDYFDDYSFDREVTAPTMKEAKKAATSIAWQACQRGLYPKKVFNAIKHAIAVSEDRGVWCRFRSDAYWVKLGIDEAILESNSSKV